MARWGGCCPACKRPFTGLRDGKRMGKHKTEFYLPFSNRRETCRYSEGTPEDAARHISPLMRRTVERIRATPPDKRPSWDVEYLAWFEEKFGDGA